MPPRLLCVLALAVGIAPTAALTWLVVSASSRLERGLPTPHELRVRPPPAEWSTGPEQGCARDSPGHAPRPPRPTHLRQAFLAAEDPCFYEHGGTGLSHLLRQLASGEPVRGSATITDQLARRLLDTSERHLIRNLKVIRLSLRLEATLSKDEILERYLDTIVLGAGPPGVEAASRAYLDKPVAEVSLAEAALLAGLAPAPSAYSPRRAPHRAKLRQLYVLEQMRQLGYLTEAQARRAGASAILIEGGAGPALLQRPPECPGMSAVAPHAPGPPEPPDQPRPAPSTATRPL